MAPADETEVYHRMHEWYHSPERDALRAVWGAYPAAPGALQAWPGFVAVTNAFLDYEAAHGRSGEPVAAEAEESGRCGFLLTLCLPLIPVSATRTRKYVNGHPTNGFDDGSDIHWHRDPGRAGQENFFAKKAG